MIAPVIMAEMELEAVRELKTDQVFAEILNGRWQIDEILNRYSNHTFLHESI